MRNPLLPNPEGIFANIDWDAIHKESKLLATHFYDNHEGVIYFERNDLGQITYISAYVDPDEDYEFGSLTIENKKYRILDEGVVKDQKMMDRLRAVKTMDDVILGFD